MCRLKQELIIVELANELAQFNAKTSFSNEKWSIESGFLCVIQDGSDTDNLWTWRQ